MGRTWLLAGLLLGCGTDPRTTAGDGSAIDAPHFDAGPPTCFGTSDAGRTERIYLNFDGVTIHGDHNADDSLTNRTLIIPDGHDAVIPPFHDGRADRAAVIAQVADMVVDILYEAGAAVEVTQQRPAEADYTMVVIGGHPQDATLPPSVLATAFEDCGDFDARDIGLVFEDDNPVHVANGIAYVIGLAAGLDLAQPIGNCMYPIGPNDARCSFARNATVDEGPMPVSPCQPVGTPEDQPAMLRSAFGCR